MTIFASPCCMAGLSQSGVLVPWGDLTDDAFEPWFNSLPTSLEPPAYVAPPSPPAAPANHALAAAVTGAVVGVLLLSLLAVAVRVVRERRRTSSDCEPQHEPVRGIPLPPAGKVTV